MTWHNNADMRALKRSLRVLLLNWQLAAVSAFSLSIAMAVGVLGLSIVNTILILAPAAPEPDRLLTIYVRTPGNPIEQISFPDYEYYRQNNHVFSGLAAAPNSISVNSDTSYEGREVKVVSRPVSANYFAVMGIRPHLGAFFAPGDDTAKDHAAVMTYSCWTRLGSDPKIVGKVITGRTIVGVLPKDYVGAFFGINGDLFTTLAEVDGIQTWREQRNVRTLFLTGRLKPGVTKQQAEAEMAALSRQLATSFPADNKDRLAVVAQATLLPPDSVETARLLGSVMMTLIMLIVLIACANVANLLLAVSVGRRQEAVIKLALGASRARLIREFLLESTILCAIGSAFGIAAVAFLINRYSELSIALPMVGVMNFTFALKLDATVIVLSLLLMAIASLASGLPPALYASSPALSQILGGEIVVGGTRKAARRNILVATQIAICTVVLIGMGLCQSSLYKLQHVDLGFTERNLAAVTVYLKGEGYEEARGKPFRETMRTTLATVPGVDAVALASDIPMLGAVEVPVQITGGKSMNVAHTSVDPAFFPTLGIRILSGRAFNSGDSEKAPLVTVINQRLAQLLWPGQDPLGRTIEAGDSPRRKFTVIGVVPDGRHLELSEDPKPFFYWALNQHYGPAVSVIVRTRTDPKLFVDSFAQALRGLGLKIMVRPVTFQSWMNLTLFGERFIATAVGILSALGLLLALVGLFAGIAYGVRERRKELGVRVALGAREGQLLGMILKQTLKVAGWGVGIGVLLGIGSSALLRSQLYGIAALEWVVLLPVGVAMLGLCALVAYASARPWVKVDPMEAVRHS